MQTSKPPACPVDGEKPNTDVSVVVKMDAVVSHGVLRVCEREKRENAERGG